MNGVSGPKNHPLLQQTLALATKAFAIPHHQGGKILQSIRRREAPPQSMHPCVKQHVSYAHCVRRYPNTYEKRCGITMTKYSECLREHSTWQPDKKMDYLSFLEELNLFGPSRRSKSTMPIKKTPQGNATIFSFKKD
jgi:hypothetical protein